MQERATEERHGEIETGSALDPVDYAVISHPHCGCPWEEMGYTQQLHTIRSYEKLTSEGMHFVGTDLIAVVEEVLPARFGGAPTDY